MKTKYIFTILTLLIIISSVSVFGQKGKFSGQWALNKEKTLTIGFTNKMSGGETSGTNYYNIVK